MSEAPGHGQRGLWGWDRWASSPSRQLRDRRQVVPPPWASATRPGPSRGPRVTVLARPLAHGRAPRAPGLPGSTPGPHAVSGSPEGGPGPHALWVHSLGQLRPQSRAPRAAPPPLAHRRASAPQPPENLPPGSAGLWGPRGHSQTSCQTWGPELGLPAAEGAVRQMGGLPAGGREEASLSYRAAGLGPGRGRWP